MVTPKGSMSIEGETLQVCPTLQVLDMSTLGNAADINTVITFLPHNVQCADVNPVIKFLPHVADVNPVIKFLPHTLQCVAGT